MEFSRRVWRSCDNSDGERGGAETDTGPATHNTREEQRQTTSADCGAQIAVENIGHNTPSDHVAEGCTFADMLPCSALVYKDSSQTVSALSCHPQSNVTNSDPILQNGISFKTHLGNRQKVLSDVTNEPSNNNGLPCSSLLDNNSMSDREANEKLAKDPPNSLPPATMKTDSKWVSVTATCSRDEYDKQVGDNASFSITANVGRVAEEDARHLELVQRDHLTPVGLSAVSHKPSSGSSASPMSSEDINYKVRFPGRCSFICANRFFNCYTLNQYA